LFLLGTRFADVTEPFIFVFSFFFLSFFFWFFFSELGTEPRALRFLGKRSATEPNPQPLFFLLNVQLSFICSCDLRACHSVCVEVGEQLVGRGSLLFYSVGPRMGLNPSGLVRSLTHWAILPDPHPHPPLVLKIALFLLCVYGYSPAYVYVHGTCAIQKRASDSVELELQAVIGHNVDVEK